MGQKKQKLIRKIFSNHKKFVHLKDEAREQCDGNEEVYERWVWDACTALHNNGAVKLTEQSPYGKLECSGKAGIKADILSSKVKCEDGQEFTQKINLKGVNSFGKFSAPVYSSLYGQEVVMNFEKI
jgi:hypothetical protein